MAGAVAALVIPRLLGAQSPYVVRRPDREWRTVETAHWRVHYPREADAFAACLVPRLEAVHSAAARVVGWAPPRPITLVIDDPLSVAGAYASTNQRAPVLVLNTQPSEPRSNEYSDCATMRMVHEITHTLQLSRPWAPGWQRTAFRLLPADIGPVIVRSPAWLRESYAEHVEGRLTSTGRQYLASRPTVLRTLALADRLPAYGALGAGYEGRYLVGAAFVNWLAAQHGDSAFARLWERLAAPGSPGLAASISAVFGSGPESLYARWAAEVKARGAEVRRRLEAVGLASGTLVRRGVAAENITVSPDGTRIAAAAAGVVTRVMIWRAADSSAAPVRLPIPNGQPPNAPRFLRDGRRLLMVSWETTGGGIWRPDLYLWDVERRALRRVTRGAGIQHADPMPDGSAAAATRCSYGVCDLVRVDLASGAVTVIAPGSPTRAFHRPRVSRDGRRIAVSVQSGARSRVAVADAGTGALVYADPDDGASRYEPAFLPDGRRLVVVSERTGIPNLELIDLETGATRPLTRVLTAAYAPEPDPRGDAVYFLLHSADGSDVHRVRLDDAPATELVVRDSALAPVVPTPVPDPPALPFAPDRPAPARPYGLGPRWYSVLPAFSAGAEGVNASAVVWTSDIVGRLSAMLQGTVGEPGTWRGGSLAVAWRGSRPPVYADLFAAEHRPSRQGSRDFTAAAPDITYRGVALATEGDRGPWARRQRVRVAASAGLLDAGSAAGGEARVFGAAEYRVVPVQVGDPWYAAEPITLGAAAGRTGGAGWVRWLAGATVEVGRTNRATMLVLDVGYGEATRGAPAFERFAIGGVRSPLVQPLALSQRLAMPMLPAGVAAGRRAAVVRAAGPRLGPLSPFVWMGSAGEEISRWHRVVGAEWKFEDDPRRNWRVPGAQLAAGLGYSLDQPPRGRVRGYVSLSFRQ